MGGFLPFFSSAFFFCASSLPAHSAQYQRAKRPIRAKVVRAALLKARPATKSPTRARLKTGTEVIIVARRGHWLEIKLTLKKKTVMGWIARKHIKVLGFVKDASKRETPKKTGPPRKMAGESKPEKSSSSVPRLSGTPSPRRYGRRAFGKPAHPVRIVLHGGYAYGAKSFPSQLRAGLDILYATWPATEAGGTVEVGFRKATLVTAGPTFVHQLQWPRLGPVRTAAYAATPFFYVSSGGDTDLLWGFRLGPELRYTAGRLGESQLVFLLRATADILLIGSETVSIPLIGSFGFSYNF